MACEIPTAYRERSCDREHHLEDLLQEQRSELIRMHLALDEAQRRGVRGAASPMQPSPSRHRFVDEMQQSPSRHRLAEEMQQSPSRHRMVDEVQYPPSRHRFVEEMQQSPSRHRFVEETLMDLERNVAPEWLSGPPSSIEHELARRRHMAEVHRLEADLAEYRNAGFQRWGQGPAQHSGHMPEASRPSGSCSPWGPNPPLASSYTHGSRMMGSAGRGSSPDLAAWPPAARPPVQPDPSLAYPRHMEVPASNILAERKRRFGDRLFRLWVEDCAVRGGVRVFAMDVLSLCESHVDLRDCDVQAMFNFFSRQCRDRMVRWIAGQDVKSTDSEHDRELREFLCCILDNAYFELDDDGSNLQLRIPAFVEPPPSVEEQTLIEVERAQDPSSPLTSRWIREKLLVPRSVAAVAHRMRSQCSTSQHSHVREASVRSSRAGRAGENSAYAAPPRQARSSSRSGRGGEIPLGSKGVPRRPSSARRPVLPVSTSIHSSNSREFLPTREMLSSRSSLIEMTRNANPNVSVSVLSEECETARPPSRQRLALGERYTPQTQRSRPNSAHDSYASNAGSTAGAVRGEGWSHGAHGEGMPSGYGPGGPTLRNDAHIGRSPEVRPDLVPKPPSVPRAGAGQGSGRPAPRIIVESGAQTLPTQHLAIAQGAQTLPTRDLGVATSAEPADVAAGEGTTAMMARSLQPDTEEAAQVLHSPQARHRLLRPRSAKATKHKRVTDADEKLTVYEDCEDSEPDDAAFEIEGAAFGVDDSACLNMAPSPTPLSRLGPVGQGMDQHPSTPGLCRHAVTSPMLDGRGFWSTAAWANSPEPPGSPFSASEPRTSSPPPRPRLV